MADQPVAIVTGGASGIGKSTAEKLLDCGYRVLICARGEERLEAAREELSAGGDVASLVADVSDHEQARRLIDEAVSRWGRLDALVNAHGIYGNDFYLLEDVPLEEWRDVIEINLMGPVHTTTAAIEPLAKTKGAVVNVSSLNAIQGEPMAAPYGVSKAALVGFTKYAAIELARHGVRVNAVLPGWVLTPMVEPFFEEAGLLGKELETNLVRRPGDPAELAEVIEFLASPRSSFVTGECLVADGGQWIQVYPLRGREESQAEG